MAQKSKMLYCVVHKLTFLSHPVCDDIRRRSCTNLIVGVTTLIHFTCFSKNGLTSGAYAKCSSGTAIDVGLMQLLQFASGVFCIELYGGCKVLSGIMLTREGRC